MNQWKMFGNMFSEVLDEDLPIISRQFIAVDANAVEPMDLDSTPTYVSITGLRCNKLVRDILQGNALV